MVMHKLAMKLLAVKTINKKLITTSNIYDKIENEIRLLKSVENEHIIKLYDTFETQDYIVIVTDLCEYGDLMTYVRKRRKISESLAKKFLVQILDALSYLSSKSILHRDIKMENILID